MRMGNRSLSNTLAAMPRGVAWAVAPRYDRVGSGVAPGAKTFFMVLAGSLGEKGLAGGLSLIVDARKMLRAVAMELLLRLLGGCSSRDMSSLRPEDVWGVSKRFAELLPPKGDAANARFAKGNGGRDLGVPLLALGARSPSLGRANVTIAAERCDGEKASAMDAEMKGRRWNQGPGVAFTSPGEQER